MRAPASPSIDELLAHTPWVQELARRLIRDPHLAEDLAQTTCATAIERPPSGGLRRGWLATVLRNLLRQHHRREGERLQREAQAARPEALPSTAAMVEKVQIQRQVVEAVLSLEEPYRSVVLWRFFEDMPPAEIARRRDVPVATVHSQLGRAMQKLYGRLQASHRDQRSLLATLVPLSRFVRPPSVSTLGALMMKAKVLSTVAVLLGTAVLAWVLWPRSEAVAPPVGDRSSPVTVGTVQTVREGPSAVRRAVSMELPVGEQSDDPAGLPIGFRGRVFDVQGRPVAGLTVAVRPEVPGLVSAPTDVAGIFELSAPPGSGQLHVVEPAWVTLVAGQVPDESSASPIEPILVAAPRVELAGLVTDRAGEPVSGADVICRIPSDFALRIPYSLDASQPLYRQWQSNTDAEGHFELPAVGLVPGATLIARKAGYLPAEVDQPREVGKSVHLVLDRPELDEEVVLGQVLDRFSDPMVGAQVVLGRRATASGEGGLFRLTRDGTGSRRITAMSRGHLPGVAEVPPTDEGAPPPFVYLYLGEEPLRIRGRVVEPGGAPVVGARVWPVEAQLLPGLNGSVEGYLSGGPTDSELVERFTSNGRLLASLGDLKERNPSAAWAWVVTGSDGSFDLGGLQERDYTLRVLVGEGLQVLDSGPHRAGDRVEIVFQPERYPVLSGRVVGLDGTPVAGVTVEVNRWATYGEVRLPDGSIYSTGDAVPGPVLRTDRDGLFRTENVGRGGLWFTIAGDDIMNQNFGLDEHGYENATTRSFDDLEFRVERRLHIRVELGDPDLADRFRVLDESGEPIPIVNFEGRGRASSGSWPIQAGRTRVYAVSEMARSVALLKGDVEVLRFPVSLRAGIVNVIAR